MAKGFQQRTRWYRLLRRGFQGKTAKSSPDCKRAGCWTRLLTYIPLLSVEPCCSAMLMISDWPTKSTKEINQFKSTKSTKPNKSAKPNQPNQIKQINQTKPSLLCWRTCLLTYIPLFTEESSALFRHGSICANFFQNEKNLCIMLVTMVTILSFCSWNKFTILVIWVIW